MICTCKDLNYTLLKSERKTMSIYVEPEGRVVVRAPKDVSKQQINAIIDLKRHWIYKSIAEFQELNKTKVTRQITNGEGFLFMGRSYRLKIEKNIDKSFTLTQGYFVIREDKIHKARELFINFYREQGKILFSKRVKYYKDKIGVNPAKIRVMDLKKRWASRSNKSLNFHWKVMLAPISVIDYIIVHELAHFMKENHGPEFWEIMESVMPSYEEKKRWLQTNGANLDI